MSSRDDPDISITGESNSNETSWGRAAAAAKAVLRDVEVVKQVEPDYTSSISTGPVLCFDDVESKKMPPSDSNRLKASESLSSVINDFQSDTGDVNTTNINTNNSLNVENSLETDYPHVDDKIIIQTNPLFTTMTGHAFLKMRRGSIDANTVRADSHKIKMSSPFDLVNGNQIYTNSSVDQKSPGVIAKDEDSDTSDLSQIVIEYEGHSDIDANGETAQVEYIIMINTFF